MAQKASKNSCFPYHSALPELACPKPISHVVKNGKVGKEGIALKNHPAGTFIGREMSDRLRPDENLALRRDLQPRNTPQGCRLPATGGSEEGEELSLLDPQVLFRLRL